MKYSDYKKQIIKAKTDENLLKDMYYYIRDNTIDLKENEKTKLLNLLVSFISLHFKNKKLNRKNKSVKSIEYLKEPINNDYLLNLIDNINFNVNNDYVIGLYNLLIDNNFIYNSIGLKIVISKYLNTLNSLNDLKVLKIDNNKLNDNFKFLVFKNNKIKNYTKLYFNNEYNLIIFNTLKHDNIVSVILYDKTKIKNINEIVLKGVVDYDKTFKHIDNIKDFQYTYNNKEEKYLENKDLIVNIFNYRYNLKVYNISFTFENIVKNFYNDIYSNDLIYNIYKDIINYEKSLDNFKSNDIDLIKTTLKDYDNFNYNNLNKGIKTTDIKINVVKKSNNYNKYLFNKMINNYFKVNNHLDNKAINYIYNRLNLL